MSSPIDKKALLAYYHNPANTELIDGSPTVDLSDAFTLHSRCISLALKRLTGRVPPQLLRPQDKPDDLVSVLEANTISYRYLSLSSLDVNNYFGFILASNSKTAYPELLYSQGTSCFRFLPHDLSTLPLSSSDLDSFEDTCIEIFSPLPQLATTGNLAGYSIKSTEQHFLLILFFL